VSQRELAAPKIKLQIFRPHPKHSNLKSERSANYSLLAITRCNSYIFIPGCSGKPAWQNKNRMSSIISFERFGARLRELIRASAGGAAGPVGDFEELALQLFALQFEHNTPYQSLCETRGLSPRAIEHWSQIPSVPTSAFKDLELTCLSAGERQAVFHSSGTTGQKLSRHYHSADSLALYRAALLAWFRARVPLERGTSNSVEAGERGGRAPGSGTIQNPKEANQGNKAPTGSENASRIDALGSPKGEPSQKRSPTLNSPYSSASFPSLPSVQMNRSGGWRWVILTPPPAEAPHSSLVYMFETIRQAAGAPESAFLGQALPDGSWRLDAETATKLTSQAAEDAQPVMVLGTAFSFVHWLDYLADRNLRFKLPAGSSALETGGYKGRSRRLPKAELDALITEHLGIPPNQIICEYGMSELSSQAYDKCGVRNSECGIQSPDALPQHSAFHTPHSALLDSPLRTPHSAFHFPPWTRVQIISPESGAEVAEGETGLLRGFDLANVYSVMAIQTEDLAIRRGDGFELLGRAALAEPRGCSLMPA
jgi:hypothetical protein